MVSNPERRQYSFTLNGKISDNFEDFVKEMGPPVTKSGVMVFLVQTYFSDMLKHKREVQEFCQKREEKKVKSTISSHNGKIKQDIAIDGHDIKDLMYDVFEKQEKTAEILRLMMDDWKEIKGELTKLKMDLGG